MILLIAFVLIGAAIAFRKAYKDDKDDKISQALLAIAGSFLGVLASIALVLFFSAVMPRTAQHYEFEKTKLVAFGDASELHGYLFLASGNIGSEQFYRFYYELPDGGKKFGKVNAEIITVYEEDRKDAYMAKVGEQDKYPNWVYLWFLSKFIVKENRWKYAIHVPKGTIKAEYNLDLK